MDENTKRQIEKEIEEFFSGIFEKYPDLHKIHMHKMLRWQEPGMPHRHAVFEIYRRHMTEEPEYKIDYTVVEYTNRTKVCK